MEIIDRLLLPLWAGRALFRSSFESSGLIAHPRDQQPQRLVHTQRKRRGKIDRA